MSDRENLIGLIAKFAVSRQTVWPCAQLADHLIANVVTVREPASAPVQQTHTCENCAHDPASDDECNDCGISALITAPSQWIRRDNDGLEE